jgi:hypothetical protein
MRFPVPTTGALSLPRLSFDLQEWGGAFGDLGLLIPITAALVLSNGFNATSVLLVFGGAYALSALYYRLPLPVPPLKAMTPIGFACGIALHFALSMGSRMLQRAGLLTPRPQPSAAQNPPPEARTA